MGSGSASASCVIFECVCVSVVCVCACAYKYNIYIYTKYIHANAYIQTHTYIPTQRARVKRKDRYTRARAHTHTHTHTHTSRVKIVNEWAGWPENSVLLVWDIKVLVYEALRYSCMRYVGDLKVNSSMRPQGTKVWGRKVLTCVKQTKRGDGLKREKSSYKKQIAPAKRGGEGFDWHPGD